MFKKKKEPKIKYEDIIEIWLTKKNHIDKYEVRTFYDQDNRYVKVDIKTMGHVDVLNYLDEVRSVIKLYRVEIEGRIMYRNKELYNKIFKKERTN